MIEGSSSECGVQVTKSALAKEHLEAFSGANLG